MCTLLHFTAYKNNLLKVDSKATLSEFVKSNGGEIKNNKPGKSVTHIITSQKFAFADNVIVLRKKGVKVLSTQWLLACKNFHKRVPEGPYTLSQEQETQSNFEYKLNIQQRAEAGDDEVKHHLNESAASSDPVDELEEETAAVAAATPDTAPDMVCNSTPDAVVLTSDVKLEKEVSSDETPLDFQEYARKRLTNWTRRFMQKRPKLELPPPEIIPLNDEYLTRFSETFTEVKGPPLLPIEPPEGKDNTSDDDNGVAKKRRSTKNAKEDPGWRVAVTNLPYHMCTVDTMHQVYGNSGTLLKVDVLMHDPNKIGDNGRSRSGPMGKCILTFQCEEECALAIKSTDAYEVGGRRLSVFPVNANGKIIGGAGRRAPKPDRYYVDPDSVKKSGPVCLNCRQPGHFVAHCPLEKRCSICARPSHSDRQCPNTVTCFRCLQSGHIARECRYQEPIVNANARQICISCGGRDHEGWQCKHVRLMVESYARCMACGEEGHLCCMAYRSDAKTEVYCCKCGERGHDVMMFEEDELERHPGYYYCGDICHDPL